MALRNYLYAKHGNTATATKINKVEPAPAETTDSQTTVSGCSSNRQLVLEDGTTQCRNCADCPKKHADHDMIPKVMVEVNREELSHRVDHTLANKLQEIDFTHSM
ncbi:uncharacterized protein CANTADRAFT_3674 [Suhomyces tanzawaensis NRRL Y-17324]|uniref:Uncharacterized protein n=1 Tax=Suhomyces tanzawaensis NRRL Y-17324 TaxID=984487 RepID=A0A1E4SPZ6_9ASCO|nr:uncharacterized protein CANTADRAFT_3674 [Suhomyces tanzawaensis NRRL Y-17324]ODV81581.1 hypothetical protein CANTADRAFT_3674 [Suhomyces tanzawaensis NRRL Y-17324]